MIAKSIRLFLVLSIMERLSISFIYTCYMLFLQANGLNLFEANMANVAFYITLFLCEIPTGAIADVFGRKRSYVLSLLLHGLSLLIYWRSSTLTGFIIAEIVGAVGLTCASGAFQAWLVDSLKHYGSTDPYMPVFAKAEQLASLVGIAGAFAGNYLFNIDIGLPWLFGGVLMLSTSALAQITIKEEYFERHAKSMCEYWNKFMDTIRRSARYTRINGNVRFLILASLFQCFAVQAANMQWQVLFKDKIHLPYLYTGIAIFTFIGYTVAKSIGWRKLNERLMINSAQIVIGLGMAFAVSIPYFPLAISMFLIHEIARGMYKPLRDAYLNDNIPSEERATLISFEAMSQHIGGVVGLFVSGFVAENTSISYAWVLSGVTLTAAALLMIKNGR